MSASRSPVHRLPPGLFIGTSGWSYPDWAQGFYADVPRADWLAHYAARFNAVEVDASFYHSLRRSTYEHWRGQTPERFRFAVKANRFLTHVKRLDFPAESLEREREKTAGLGAKLAVVLWQLQATTAADLERLEGFLARLEAWPQTRHAVEFRHASWFTDEVAVRLADHRVAACQSDAASWPLWPAITTDLVLLRLHGHERTYRSAYGKAGLAPWAGRIRDWLAAGRTVYVFFDNTDGGHATEDAALLAALLA